MDKIPWDKARIMGILEVCTPERLVDIVNKAIDAEMSIINKQLEFKRMALHKKTVDELDISDEHKALCQSAINFIDDDNNFGTYNFKSITNDLHIRIDTFIISDKKDVFIYVFYQHSRDISMEILRAICLNTAGPNQYLSEEPYFTNSINCSVAKIERQLM